ncbi:MAG TPA: maltotransferase domain-containing protein, partial [Chloroflexota bacterium]|nr:maltotransferase domain-containing protein [Chloroflexota bacterium]
MKGARSNPLPNEAAVIVENVQPRVDCGRFPAKRELGDLLQVSADIFAEGHGLLAAVVKYRGGSDGHWYEEPMKLVDNDRWTGSFLLEQIGCYQYTVEAWRDGFGSWRSDVRKKADAGEDVAAELLDGWRMLGEANTLSRRGGIGQGEGIHPPAEDGGRRNASPSRQLEYLLSDEVAAFMATHPDRSHSTVFGPPLELVVERERARFAAWYEMFPRSQGTRVGRGATFREAQARLPDIAAMGFDVVYLPPIHPIGRQHRKGKNNIADAAADDVGSPWAIGDETGGHTTIHPQLGTLDDFLEFQATARDLGLEVALDIAFQCTSDHPWTREHPEWFRKRPDGSIQYAENPPKKYQDIYPLDFETSAWRGLWQALREVFEFWIEQGVRIFRVDNPHTKA